MRRITIGALNVDENPEITFRYAIDSVPTLILFATGHEVDRIKGVTSPAWLKRAINRYMTPASPSKAARSDKSTPHQVLGVKVDATPAEIAAAYRRLAQMYHPDKVQNLAPEWRNREAKDARNQRGLRFPYAKALMVITMLSSLLR